MSIGWALYLAGGMLILGYSIRYALEKWKFYKMWKILVHERLVLNEILERVKKNPEEFTQDEVKQYQFDSYLLNVRMGTFNKADYIVSKIL